MKVRLINESSGFGYSSKISTWIGENEEHLGKLKNIQKGDTVEIPEKIAISIHNLVNVETGEIISRRSSVKLSSNEIKKRYMKGGFETVSKIRSILTPDTPEEISTRQKDIEEKSVKENVSEEKKVTKSVLEEDSSIKSNNEETQ